MCAHTHTPSQATVYIWKSEDNSGESILSFQHIGPRAGTQPWQPEASSANPSCSLRCVLMPMIFFFLYLFFLIIKLMNTIIVELKKYTFKTLVGKTVKCSTDSIVSVLISVVQYIVVY